MEFPKLHFEYEFDDLLAYETESKGYLGGVTVELADGSKHPVYFYNAVRLAQDLEEEAKMGRPFLAERGMIALQSITMENMKRAVAALEKQGFFKQ